MMYVPVPSCGVMVSPTELHSFLFCTSCLNIPCAEAKLNKKRWLYKLFKPGEFARVLDFLCIEGPCLCQQAAWPSRSKLVEPGAWYWWPDIHTLEMLTSSSLDLWTGHPARGRVLCSCNVSSRFQLSEEKPSCSRAALCRKVFFVMSGHGQETCFKVCWAEVKQSGDTPRKSQFPVLEQTDSYWTNVNFSHLSFHLG